LSHFDPKNPNRLEFSNIFSAVLRTDLQVGNGFNVSKVAVDGLSYFFQKTFTGASESLRDRPNGIGALGNMYYPSSLQPIYESDDLNATFAALATSITNSIRANSDYELKAAGRMGTTVTLYTIRWMWLILPFTLIIFGHVFAHEGHMGRELSQDSEPSKEPHCNDGPRASKTSTGWHSPKILVT